MPVTYSGTGDDVSFSVANAWTQNTQQHLWMGWYYPTALTAGRRYFGNVAVTGLEVGPTTSELRFVLDSTTTDGVWDTSGAGITTNKWYFVAAAVAVFNTGPQNDAAFWVGTLEDPPVEISRSVTVAAVGTAAGNAQPAVGNQGSSGTVAFQGDIAMWQHIVSTTIGGGGMWSQTAQGTLDAGAKDIIYRRFVLPYWQEGYIGRVGTLFRGLTSEQTNILHGPGLPPHISVNVTASAVRLDQPLSSLTATASARECPRPLIQPLHSPQLRRR